MITDDLFLLCVNYANKLAALLLLVTCQHQLVLKAGSALTSGDVHVSHFICVKS